MSEFGEERVDLPAAVAAEARRLQELWQQFANSRVPVTANCSCCPPGGDPMMFIDGIEFEQDILDFLNENFMTSRDHAARALLSGKGGYKPGEAGSLSAFLAAIAELEESPGARLDGWPRVVGDLARTIELLTAFSG